MVDEDVKDFLGRFPEAKRLRVTHQGNGWTVTPIAVTFDLRQRADECGMKVTGGSGYIAIAQYDIDNDKTSYLVDRV